MATSAVCVQGLMGPAVLPAWSSVQQRTSLITSAKVVVPRVAAFTSARGIRAATARFSSQPTLGVSGYKSVSGSGIKSVSWKKPSCNAVVESHRLRLRSRLSFNCAIASAFQYAGEEGSESDVLVQYEGEEEQSRPTVAVFWDLDNKPPTNVPPYDAAVRLKMLAGKFGEVVDMVAYANQNAFSYVPVRVREERQDRKMLDQLEKRGVVKPIQPYLCRMCGRKCKTNVDLTKHFKQLHERERNKRMARAGQLKGKRRTKFMGKVADKEIRYKDAARTILVPKVGYGLASDLKRAGVMVRTVEKRPQAADEALLEHMNLYISRGIECICLVSDDSDFREILEFARNQRICTVVIGDTGILRRVADTSFSWEEVASGRAMLTASSKYQRWAEDALKAELLSDDEFDGLEDDDLEDDASFRVKSSGNVSAFADDEDGYISEEEDTEEDDQRYSDWGWGESDGRL